MSHETNKSDFKTKVKFTAAGMALVAAGFGGYKIGQAGIEIPEAPKPAAELRNVTLIEAKWSAPDHTDAATLNKWLAANPHKRVVGVAAFSEPNTLAPTNAYQVLTENGPQHGEHFSYVDASTDEGMRTAPAAGVQTWIDEHPDQQIVAFSALPYGGRSGGGIDAYMICSQPREEG